MFRLNAVAAYRVSTTFIFVVTKHLTTVTSKWVWYIDIYFHLHKAYLNTVGKVGELNVRTYVLVNFVTPSQRTVILRTSVTHCSTMPSLISSLFTLFKAGQQIIPLDVFNDEWGVMEHFRPQNVFICSRFFSCASLAHLIKRSPDLRFFMLFGSPAIIIMVLCTTHGEREEIVSPSFSEWSLLFYYSINEGDSRSLTFYLTSTFLFKVFLLFNVNGIHYARNLHSMSSSCNYFSF